MGRRKGDPPLEAAQNPVAFADCRRRLDAAIASACARELPWAGRTSAAIVAALELAAADPFAARVLTVHSAYRRLAGRASFTAMVDQLAARLGRDAPPVARPVRRAEVLVTRIARQTLLQMETRPVAPVSEIAPDLVVLTLTPYIGLVEARDWATSQIQG